jgi:hypothetical protein
MRLNKKVSVGRLHKVSPAHTAEFRCEALLIRPRPLIELAIASASIDFLVGDRHMFDY